MAFKLDLDSKKDIFIKKRIETISKNKPLLRDFKDIVKDTNSEFSEYISWKFFGIIMVIFYISLFYSIFLNFKNITDNYSFIILAIQITLLSYNIAILILSHANLKKQATANKK